MKIVNVCESSLLATEVYSLLKNDARNTLAFTERDPLENPDVTNPDHLRRLVATRRTCQYIETSLGSHQVASDPVFPSAVAALKSHNITNDLIAKIIDSLALVGHPEGSQIYCPLILADSDNDQVRRILCILAGNSGHSSTEERIAAIQQCTDDVGPASKRRTSSRKK